MTIFGVICKSDSYLHLAPAGDNAGVSIFTLCLERWKDRTECREDSVFCPECARKYEQLREKGAQR